MKSDHIYLGIISILVCSIGSWLFFYKLPNIEGKLDELQKQIGSSNTSSLDKELGSLKSQISNNAREINKTLIQLVDRITKVEKEQSILPAALNTKFPELNLPALISSLATSQKNVSVQDVHIFFQKYQKNPSEAKAYLSDQWQIRSNQSNVIFSPPAMVAPQQKSQIRNPTLESPVRNLN